MKENKRDLYVIVAFIIAILGGAVYYFFIREDALISGCKQAVIDTLKSPSTANFSNMEESKYSLGYTKGVVDSQNGFGAMVRTKFICLTVDNSTTVMATDDNMSDYNTYNRIAFDESLSADEREKETKKQFNAQIDILNKALGK